VFCKRIATRLTKYSTPDKRYRDCDSSSLFK